jgi:hypothetical protein
LSRGSGTRANGTSLLAAVAAVALVRATVEPSSASLRLRGGRSLPVICPIRLVTGRPCLSCGMARGVALLCHGRIREAREVNAASPLAFAFLLALLVEQVAPRAPQPVRRPLSSLPDAVRGSSSTRTIARGTL